MAVRRAGSSGHLLRDVNDRVSSIETGIASIRRSQARGEDLDRPRVQLSCVYSSNEFPKIRVTLRFYSPRPTYLREIRFLRDGQTVHVYTHDPVAPTTDRTVLVDSSAMIGPKGDQPLDLVRVCLEEYQDPIEVAGDDLRTLIMGARKALKLPGE